MTRVLSGMAGLAINSRPLRQASPGADRRRLALALCASIFAHYCLLAIGPGASVVRPAQLAPSGISARLLITPSVDTESAVRDVAAPPRGLLLDRSAIAPLGGLRRPALEKSIAGGASIPAHSAEQSAAIPRRPVSLPASVDTTWYGAQDIDTYPRSGVPLRFAPPPGSGVARLLLWLRIDEHGEVVEVSAGEPDIPVSLVDALRASLVAIRFTPARKDERAVRSRLLVSVSFADTDRD